MKIGIIAHSVFPIKQPYLGGLERFIHQLATKLADEGLDITLYCHKDSADGPYKKIVFTDFEYKFDNNYDSLNLDYLSLIEELKVNSYDLLHNNSLNSDILSLSKYNTPFLTTIHVPPIAGFEQSVYENFFNKNSFYNIISSSCLKSWGALDRCKVIHNGIDVNEWNHNLGERKGAIWFGRICPEKGVENSIVAAKEAGIHLTVAGIINNHDYFNRLKFFYKDYFTYIGLCNHQELNKLIATSKVFIKAPVWEEPFGLVYLESLACGTPIATYNSNIAKELLNNKVARISNSNPQSLSIAINRAVNLNKEDCRLHVKENFSLSTMVNNYIEYYTEILNCIR